VIFLGKCANIALKKFLQKGQVPETTFEIQAEKVTARGFATCIEFRRFKLGAPMAANQASIIRGRAPQPAMSKKGGRV
jgi:hypothetical protein